MNIDQHLTFREIMRQQHGWLKALGALAGEKERLSDLLERYRDREWVFSGCGTSFYLAQIASQLFGRLSGFRTRALPASEILIFPDAAIPRRDDCLLVAISRSGTTTEMVLAEKKAREELGVPTLAVSCEQEADLAGNSLHRLAFPFQREESVVMTGSFTTMLLSIVALAARVSGPERAPARFDALPAASEAVMMAHKSLMKEIADQADLRDFVFLGQGPYFGLANEAALKMQEMAIVSSLSFHCLEYRHGPMSTVTPNTLITILASHAGKILEKNLVRDMKQLGARLLVLHTHEADWVSEWADWQVRVDGDVQDFLTPFLYMPVLQLLGYYKALAKGINPDTPQNLSQVVTL